MLKPTPDELERGLADEDGSFGIYFAWHLQNVEIAPGIKGGAGIAFDRRRHGFDRRLQHYAAYTSCSRISFRRMRIEKCPAPGNLNLRLTVSLDVM